MGKDRVRAEERLTVLVGGHGGMALLEGDVPHPHHAAAHQQDRFVAVGPLGIVHRWLVLGPLDLGQHYILGQEGGGGTGRRGRGWTRGMGRQGRGREGGVEGRGWEGRGGEGSTTLLSAVTTMMSAGLIDQCLVQCTHFQCIADLQSVVVED